MSVLATPKRMHPRRSIAHICARAAVPISVSIDQTFLSARDNAFTFATAAKARRRQDRGAQACRYACGLPQAPSSLKSARRSTKLAYMSEGELPIMITVFDVHANTCRQIAVLVQVSWLAALGTWNTAVINAAFLPLATDMGKHSSSLENSSSQVGGSNALQACQRSLSATLPPSPLP